MSNKKKSPSGHPGRTSDSLEGQLLASVKATQSLVQRAEREIGKAARSGEGVAEAVRLHLFIRAGSLAMLEAYSQISGMPSPTGMEFLEKALEHAGPSPQVAAACPHRWIADGTPTSAFPRMKCSKCGARPD